LPRGSRRLPDRGVELLRAADLILHAGDVSSVAALEELQALGPPLVAVYGNADEPELRRLLPESRVVEVEQARIGMLHVPGPRAGRDARLAARFPGADAVLYGHTHVPRAERVGGIWLLNPGSPTERRRAPSRSMLLVDVRGRRLDPQLVALS
jgi:putative phosphoesterase